MSKLITLKPNRYTVVCERDLLAKYVDHVDMRKANEVSKRLYRSLKDEYIKNNGEYHSDDVMIALAMMVNRFGHEMTAVNPINEWASDGFPEFCSLIGPGSGFAVREKEKP